MFKRVILGLTISLLGSLVILPTADAQSVSYQVLKYGTNDLSYASAYFVNPGEITPAGDHYQVTLVIATQHDLGRFPVTILTINNQKPAVSQTTQGDTDYDTVSFTVTDPKQRLTGTMQVDVPSLNYHHTYDFNLRLAAQDVPPLSPATQSTAQASIQTAATSSTNTTREPQQAGAPSVTPQTAVTDKVETSPKPDDSQQQSNQPQPSSHRATTSPQVHKAKPHATGPDWSLWRYGIAGLLLGSALIVCHLLWSKKQGKGA